MLLPEPFMNICKFYDRIIRSVIIFLKREIYFINRYEITKLNKETAFFS